MSAVYENLDQEFSSIEGKMAQLEEKLTELERAFLFLDFLAAGGLEPRRSKDSGKSSAAAQLLTID